MYNYISCIPAALRHYWKDIQSVKKFRTNTSPKRSSLGDLQVTGPTWSDLRENRLVKQKLFSLRFNGHSSR